MAGLVYLAVIGLYFYVFYIVVKKAVKKAREKGRPGWHYGLPAFLAMYLPVFWDHIPTLIVHQYQCMNNAGLTVYKTPEQWKAENPGVAETLIPDDKFTTHHGNGFEYYTLNQKINWETQDRRLPLGLVHEENYRISDAETKEILIEQKDYDIGINNPYVGNAGFRDYKIWLWLSPCSESINQTQWHYKAKNFSDYLYEYKHMN